jgi:hypothetical protein
MSALLAWQAPPATQTWAPLKLEISLHTHSTLFFSPCLACATSQSNMGASEVKNSLAHTEPCFSLLAWQVPPATQTWAPLKLEISLHTHSTLLFSPYLAGATSHLNVGASEISNFLSSFKFNRPSPSDITSSSKDR